MLITHPTPIVVVPPGKVRWVGCWRTNSASILPTPPKYIAGSPIPMTTTATIIATSLMIATHAIPLIPLV